MSQQMKKKKRVKQKEMVEKVAKSETVVPVKSTPLVAPPTEISSDILSVLNGLAMTKAGRKRMEIMSAMELILDRIKLASLQVDMSSDLCTSPSMTERNISGITESMPYDATKRKIELNTQRSVLESLDNFSGKLMDRQSYKEEVYQWLKSVECLDDEFVGDEEMERRGKEYRMIETGISEALNYAADLAEKIRVMGLRLLKDAGYLDSDDEEDEGGGRRKALLMLKKMGDVPKAVYDEEALLDEQNYHTAVAEIKRILEMSIRMVRTQNEKNIVRHGCKQYKFIVRVMDRRINELKATEEENLNLAAKVDQLTRSTGYLKEVGEKLERKNNALDSKVLKLKSQLRELEKIKPALEEEVKRRPSPSTVQELTDEEVAERRGSSHDILESESLWDSPTVRKSRRRSQRKSMTPEEQLERQNDRERRATVRAEQLLGRIPEQSGQTKQRSKIETIPEKKTKRRRKGKETKSSTQSEITQNSTTAEITQNSTTEFLSTQYSSGSLTSKSSGRIAGRFDSDFSTDSNSSALIEANLVIGALQDEIHVLRKQVEHKNAHAADMAKAIDSGFEVTFTQMSKKSVISFKTKEEARTHFSTIMNMNDGFQQQVMKLKSELESKNELLEYQDRRIHEMREDLGLIDLEALLSNQQSEAQGAQASKVPEVDTKKLIHKMATEHGTEIQRLRTHLDKEQLRHDAALRRLEQIHIEQMATTHKQSVHLLRAINRFKDAVAQILERGSLIQAAQEVREISNLRITDLPSEARIVLAQMGSNAVEMMVAIEFKLSQALMNNRMEVKDTAIARKFTVKDLQTRKEASWKAKKAAESVAEQLKETKEKLKTAEDALLEIRQNEDYRYQGVVERYRKLMSQYAALQKQNRNLMKEHGDMQKSKEHALRKVVDHSNKLAKVTKDQQLVITEMQDQVMKRRDEQTRELQLSIVDQKHNLEELEKALLENKISKELYALTVEVIKQSMELPVLRLRQLFYKYITYRRLRDTREKLVQEVYEKYAGENKDVLDTFLNSMDHRIVAASRIWQEKQNELETKRKDIFDKMANVLNDVVTETGILLITPEWSQQKQREREKKSETTKSPTPDIVSTKTKAKPTRVQKVVRKSPKLNMPVEMVGTGIAAEEAEHFWTLPPISPITAQVVSAQVPNILDLDVNRQIRAAQRALKRISYRQPYKMAVAEAFTISQHQVMYLHRAWSSQGEAVPSLASLVADGSEKSSLSTETDNVIA